MVKSKRFTEEQIIEMFKEHEASTKVPSTGRMARTWTSGG